MLGGKGCALRTVDKDILRGIPNGPDPCPLDERITDRRARIRAKDRTRTGIDCVRAIQCKAGAIRTLMAAKKQGLHTSKQNTQAAVAALIFMKSMVRMGASHARSEPSTSRTGIL